MEKEIKDIDVNGMKMENFLSTNDGSPSVYVGTYAKYNNGNLYGAWIDITACSDYDEFMDVCRALHADERDPEFMAQDYENFPDVWYTEGFISEQEFDCIRAYGELESCDKDKLIAFMDCTSERADIDIFEKCDESYVGVYDSQADFAEQLYTECGDLANVPEHIVNYIDWERVAHDLFIGDFYYDERTGCVFRCY